MEYEIVYSKSKNQNDEDNKRNFDEKTDKAVNARQYYVGSIQSKSVSLHNPAHNSHGETKEDIELTLSRKRRAREARNLKTKHMTKSGFSQLSKGRKSLNASASMYSSPLKSGTKSAFSNFVYHREPKISKMWVSAKSPFRKTQTSIKQKIEHNEAINPTWEDAMDKNFELMARVVEQKQNAKDENLQKRYYMNELLDEMDEHSAHNNMILPDIDKIQTHNRILGKFNDIFWYIWKLVLLIIKFITLH